MVISESSISDIIYVCRNSDKLSKIIEVIEDFTFDSSIIIATYGQQVIRNTCGLYKRQAGDFEDYLQYFCAESQDCAAIYTMDKDFPRMRIQVREYE